MFTCSQARQARTRPGLATEDLHSSPETVRRIIEELDLRYEKIPEEYKDQNSCDNIRFTSSSVSSSGYSSRSSVCRDGSDSQKAIASMIQMMVSPDSVDDEDKPEEMKINEALAIFAGKSPRKTRRRGSWQGRRQSLRDLKLIEELPKTKRQTKSLHVIIGSLLIHIMRK